MIYATHDNDGLKINRGALIFAFGTREAAEDWLRRGWKHANFTVEIYEGEYGDCLFRTIDPPTDFSPFQEDELIIQSPGQHPGGAFYWVTPCVPVLVAVAGEEKE